MTNNDTSTLNGALQELGETMAENLTTMGVPSTYDEGLTTLAGKILEIAPVPPTPAPASIDLTGTKSILSYADSESSVLTATVLDANDDPVENVSVELYKAGVLWDTLTTDSSGEVSKTYTSAGVGDITFEAKCNLLTKTFVVEDCIDYQPLTSNVHQSRWTIPSAVTSSSTFGYSNDGWKFGNASTYSRIQYNSLFSAPMSIEFELKDYSGSLSPIVAFYNQSQSQSINWNNTNVTLSKNVVMRTEYDGTSLKVFKDDVLMNTFNSVGVPFYFELHTGSSRMTQIKNLKIKPL